MKKFTSESRFQFPGELRSHIKEEFTTVVPESDNFSLGYYQKGRGNSKIFLINENNMDTMYTQYAEAQEILGIRMRIMCVTQSMWNDRTKR